MRTLVLLLLCVGTALGQTLNVSVAVNAGSVQQQPAPGTGGPDVYYYGSAGSASATLIGYWFSTLFLGDEVTASAAGSVTMIGAKLVETSGVSKSMSISLWKYSGGNWILHECVDFTLAASWAGGWTNATLSTPYTIGASEAVRVMYTCSDVAGNVGWYGGAEASGGYREIRTWANRCSSTVPSWTSDEHAGARIYVD